MPFATLDPSSKRLRFPRDFEVIVTDTVGFIRDLPSDLKQPSRPLSRAGGRAPAPRGHDLTDAAIERRMEAVEEILRELGLEKRPRIRVFNKADRVGKEAALLGWALRRVSRYRPRQVEPAAAHRAWRLISWKSRGSRACPLDQATSPGPDQGDG
jgi:GTP-binding protein HflX